MVTVAVAAVVNLRSGCRYNRGDYYYRLQEMCEGCRCYEHYGGDDFYGFLGCLVG